MAFSSRQSERNNSTIFCQYQNQFCSVPLKELFKIPDFLSAIPSQLIPYLVGVQVYQTNVVRCNFSVTSISDNGDFSPGSLTFHTLSDKTVSYLISMILNQATNA